MEDNIKIDLKDIGCDGVYWIRVAEDRVNWRTFVNTIMNFRFL